MKTHTETIICPRCKSKQIKSKIYVAHKCKRCKYINTESDWIEYDGGDVMLSAYEFKTKIIKKLTAFYAYGNELGYSNVELSRIRSCISKIEETPV